MNNEEEEDFDRLEWYLLGILLVEFDTNPSAAFVPITTFLNYGTIDVNRTQIYNGLVKLVSAGMASQELVPPDSREDKPEMYFGITPKGVYYTFLKEREISENVHGVTWDYPDEIINTLDRILDEIKEYGNNFIPASDRIVDLNHNSANYKTAINSLDVAIEAVRIDNEYGARNPEDKAQRLAELSAGRRLLEAGRIALGLADRLIMRTLIYLAGIGVAVSQIADAIVKIRALLGL